MKNNYNCKVLFYLKATSKNNITKNMRLNFTFILNAHTHFLSITTSYFQKKVLLSEEDVEILFSFSPFSLFTIVSLLLPSLTFIRKLMLYSIGFTLLVNKCYHNLFNSEEKKFYWIKYQVIDGTKEWGVIWGPPAQSSLSPSKILTYSTLLMEPVSRRLLLKYEYATLLSLFL